MCKISIVVPIYNAGKWLKRCLDSILNQSYKNIELILVNDGSSDDSGDICNDYARRDNRVKVIYQQNQGVSIARNNGIACSTGDYIGFVDADDEINVDMYEKLLDTAMLTSSDIVLCDSLAVKDGEIIEYETISCLAEDCTLCKTEITPNILLEIAGSVWRGLYSAQLIKDKVAFLQDLKIAEDRVFNIYAMGRAKRIAYVKAAYYRRNLLKGSTVHKYHSDYYETIKKGRDATAKALRDNWMNDEKFQITYLNQYVYGSIRAIENIKHKDSPLSRHERYKKIKEICEDESLIKAIIKTEYNKKDEKARWILEKRTRRLSRKNLKFYRFFRRVLVFLKRKFIKEARG